MVSSILTFHERRQFLLECLRLTVELSLDSEDTEKGKEPLRELVRLILGTNNNQSQIGSMFWRKCISSMADLERWLQQLTERLQSASVIGQVYSAEALELLRFQSYSLTRQHESLGALASYLVKAAFTTSEDLRILIAQVTLIDRHDALLLHYIPCVVSSISRCAYPDGPCTLREARSLDEFIRGEKDAEAWPLRSFHAAIIVWWLAEYSGRYLDHVISSPLQGVDLQAEAQNRTLSFMDALRDGAFHFMLSISQDVKSSEWLDPARQGLTSFLLQDTPVLPGDSVPTMPYFQKVLMEQLQRFTDALITNMPDTLRKLKVEEDEQRKQLRGRYQRGRTDYELHLERFLVIISYAFEEAPDAAEAFWGDTEGNLFGFLQWAAKRQSTPRVAAFCEMLRSLSQDEECANAAHKFLQDEGSQVMGKMRRTSSLSWDQIFNELQFYASTIRDKPAAIRRNAVQDETPGADQVSEPESALMLEAYLRLVAHLCRESKAARNFVLSHETFRLHEVLLLLASSDIETRLRACVFTTLAALMTGKTSELNDGMWVALDQWVAGGFNPSTGLARSVMQRAFTPYTEKDILEKMGTGFEEPNAFIGLLQALLTPVSNNTAIYDRLPFPETLGSAYRMPGIDPYVDFAMGLCLRVKSNELQDPAQLRILRLTCLNFTSTCIATFNEDLVVFANKSSIPVESVMHTSSLAAYARLHPFARVMEWLFNDQVLRALFSTVLQDVEEVNSAVSDSPLVLGLIKGIEVMNLVMTLQATYIDIIRPILKTQSVTAGQQVANPALESFEDAISTHLEIIPRLGLYCGTGHQDLTIVSLRLLERISSSSKLATPTRLGFGREHERSIIISAMEAGGESERIAKSLVSAMQLDERELEEGPSSPGLVIKASILSFLNSCLAAFPNRPTIAHSLLGFSCTGTSISIPEEGLFAYNASLFHAIMRLAVDFPNGNETGFVSWLATLEYSCVGLLRALWRSPLSATYVNTELRATEYVFAQTLKQVAIDSTTLWDGLTVNEPIFYITDAAVALTQFLRQRSAYFEYAAMELRATAKAGMPTLQARIQAALLGSTVLPEGEQLQNPTIFDLFDFIELEVGSGFHLPALNMLKDLDFDICQTNEPGAPSTYDLHTLEELLALKRSELLKFGKLSNPSDEQQFQQEAGELLRSLHGSNQRMQAAIAHHEALKSWVQLMVVMIETCQFEPTAKASFILQTLQSILPKFERSCSENVAAAVELARLARTMLHHVDFESSSFERSKAGDPANDKLFQVFRSSLDGIHCLLANSTLRTICYDICYRYLRGLYHTAGKSSLARRRSMQAVKRAGVRLIDVVCDDALAGEATCRVAALLFLEALVTLAQREESKLMIESFIRLGFITMLVDLVKSISDEVRRTEAAGRSLKPVLGFWRSNQWAIRCSSTVIHP